MCSNRNDNNNNQKTNNGNESSMLLWQSYEDEKTVIGDTLYILVDDGLGRKCVSCRLCTLC